MFTCASKETKLKGDTRAEETAGQNEKRGQNMSNVTVSLLVSPQVYFPVKILVLQPGLSSTFRLVVIGVSSQH